MIEAKKASMEEVRASKDQLGYDPFTRRRTMPTMASRARKPYEELTPMIPAPLTPDDDRKMVGPADNDLYSLHDFEIDLDISLPPGMYYRHTSHHHNRLVCEY